MGFFEAQLTHRLTNVLCKKTIQVLLGAQDKSAGYNRKKQFSQKHETPVLFYFEGFPKM